MGLFDIFKKKKEYDLEKDNLTIDFDIYKMKYVVRQGDTIIPYEKLNEITKQAYNVKKKEYMDKQVERCNKLKEMGYEFSSLESFSEVKGTMCKEAEEILLPLVEEENVVIGIHRVGANVDNNLIDNMLNNGVVLSGHGFNVQSSKPDLGLNFGLYYDNKTILKEVMNAHAYKESKGSVVVRIPDEDLKGNIYVVNEHGNYCLNPKYIVGYFAVDENHNVISVRKPQKQENKAYDYKYNGEQTNLVNEEENTINKAM